MILKAYQRNTEEYELTVSKGDSTDISGVDIEFIVRDREDDILLLMNNLDDDGLTIDDEVNGIVSIKLSNNDTDLDEGTYYYEVLIVGDNGDRHTTLQGELFILKSISE